MQHFTEQIHNHLLLQETDVSWHADGLRGSHCGHTIHQDPHSQSHLWWCKPYRRLSVLYFDSAVLQWNCRDVSHSHPHLSWWPYGPLCDHPCLLGPCILDCWDPVYWTYCLLVFIQSVLGASFTTLAKHDQCFIEALTMSRNDVACLLFIIDVISCRTFTIDRMPVFFKQRDNLFFPAWAFVVPTSLVRLPIGVLESLIWSIITWAFPFLNLIGGRPFSMQA